MVEAAVVEAAAGVAPALGCLSCRRVTMGQATRLSPPPRPSSASRTCGEAPAGRASTAQVLSCSLWEAAGVSLDHGATAQYDESQIIPPSEIEPGDLIFYHFADDGGFPITHVAMYVGSGPYGTQTIIQAEQTGTVVGFFPMYWVGFVAVGRP